MRSGKIEVIFSSNPVEIKPNSVVLDCGGTMREIPNDYVWVFAGGIAPSGFLKQLGVQFGSQVVSSSGETPYYSKVDKAAQDPI